MRKQDGTKQDGTKQDGTKQDGTKQDGTKQDGTKIEDQAPLLLDTGAAVAGVRAGIDVRGGIEKASRKRRSPLVMKVQAPDVSEKRREQSAVQTLRWLGYEVCTLGKPIPVTCRNPKCRTFQWASLTGNSPGVSDIIVSHRTYWVGPGGQPLGLWKMLETKKGDKAPRRKEQVELADAGLSTFYVTEEQVVRAVIDIEGRLGLAPNPRLLDWLKTNTKGGWHKENAALLANDTPHAAWTP